MPSGMASFRVCRAWERTSIKFNIPADQTVILPHGSHGLLDVLISRDWRPALKNSVSLTWPLNLLFNIFGINNFMILIIIKSGQ